MFGDGKRSGDLVEAHQFILFVANWVHRREMREDERPLLGGKHRGDDVRISAGAIAAGDGDKGENRGHHHFI